MPGVARLGVDFAGGLLIVEPRTVYVNGAPIGCFGDEVTPHGDPPHSPAPIITEGVLNVLASGIPIAVAGMLASCGHPISPGSANVMAGATSAGAPPVAPSTVGASSIGSSAIGA